MNLSDKEKNMVKQIMENYKKFHDLLNLYSSQLENLKGHEKDQNNIDGLSYKIVSAIKSLENERMKEKDFISDLSNKYGDGTLDFNTFEYVLKDKP